EHSPRDQLARDRISTELGETLFVEAGAGTGKTTALVGRIVSLIESGVAMREIAAITFTEAAAAELKDRVRYRLDVRRAEVDPGSNIETLCNLALGDLDGAALQTLHAFAQRILSAFPLEAGLPPQIEIADEIRSGIAFEEDWARLMDDMLTSENQSLARAFTLGLEVRHLRSIALDFHNNLDRVEGAVFADTKHAGDWRFSRARLEEAFALTEPVLARGGMDTLVRFVESLRTFRRSLERLQDDDERLTLLGNRKSLAPKDNAGNQGAWGKGGAKGAVHNALRAAEAERTLLVSSAKTACLMPILRRLQQFTLDRATDRRERGVLQFNDLLVLAAQLLRGNPEVRKTMAGRFLYLLIDEFQDTDPLQLEIATLLATSADDVDGLRWDEVPIRPGKLFFVGDPKQSIYRFRRADIQLYQSARKHFGGQLDLTANFRARREILEFVNLVFTALIEPRERPGQPAYVELTGGRASEIAGPAVHLIGGPVSKDHGNRAHELRDAEAADIVRLINSVRGQWSVTAEDGSTRPAQLNDIAILLPTRNTFQSLERKLENEDIPYRLESRSLLYATQEVVDLTNVLAAIDDPTDDISIVAALRSPAFGCADDELYEFVKAGGQWDYTGKIPEAPGTPFNSIPAALKAIAQMHASRRWYSVSELVDRVLRERRLFEVAFAHRRPRESWQRLRFVLEQARAFGEGGGTTLRQFVDWLRTQAEAGSRVTESIVPESDDDAVRVMTIHAAKGLEFPIVILAGLDRQTRSDRSIAIWATAEQTPEVRVGSEATGYFDTPGFDAVKGFETEMAALEDLRLYYVAATRARDHLIVSLYHKETSRPATAAARTYALCAERRSWFISLENLPTVLPSAAESTPSAPDADPIGTRAAWLTKRAALIASSTRANTMAATAIAKRAADASPEKAEQSDLDQPWRRGRAGTSIGRAVHAVLQSVDLATGEGLEEAAGAQSVAEGIPERRAEIVELVRTALASNSVRTAVSSGRFWRELYVGADVDGTVVEGFIDLLYESPEGLVVVDYKTDEAGNDERVDLAMERYELQGAAYALALETALPGRRVTACTFVFVRPSREERVANLAESMLRVRELLREAATPAIAPA
ncbi:MAG: UvrD-helicase domain-containing protein, partial [Anaerolineaceae bacterium]